MHFTMGGLLFKSRKDPIQLKVQGTKTGQFDAVRPPKQPPRRSEEPAQALGVYVLGTLWSWP